MKTSIIMVGTLGDEFGTFIDKAVEKRKRIAQDLYVLYNGANFCVTEDDTKESLAKKYQDALELVESAKGNKKAHGNAADAKKTKMTPADWDIARVQAAINFVTVTLGKAGMINDPTGEAANIITKEAIKYADVLIKNLRGKN